MVDFKKLSQDPQERRRLLDELEAERKREVDRTRQIIDALRTPTRPLTDWEERFVVSVSGALDLYGSLTEKQIKVLERIHRERCP